jgi:hypothetical protein
MSPFSTTQDDMVDTSKFISKGETWNNLYAGIIPFKEMTLILKTSLEDEQRAKCRGVVDGP